MYNTKVYTNLFEDEVSEILSELSNADYIVCDNIEYNICYFVDYDGIRIPENDLFLFVDKLGNRGRTNKKFLIDKLSHNSFIVNQYQ